MAAREACCSAARAPEVWNSRRREGSMRATLPRPQEAQMLAALADQAVVKLSRGPTWARSAHWDPSRFKGISDLSFHD